MHGQLVRMPPGAQQRLLHDVLGPLTVPADQAQHEAEQRAGMLGVQPTNQQLFAVDAWGKLLGHGTIIAAGQCAVQAGQAYSRLARRLRYSAMTSSVSSATLVSAVGLSNVISPCWSILIRSQT